MVLLYVCNCIYFEKNLIFFKINAKYIQEYINTIIITNLC